MHVSTLHSAATSRDVRRSRKGGRLGRGVESGPVSAAESARRGVGRSRGSRATARVPAPAGRARLIVDGGVRGRWQGHRRRQVPRIGVGCTEGRGSTSRGSRARCRSGAGGHRPGRRVTEKIHAEQSQPSRAAGRGDWRGGDAGRGGARAGAAVRGHHEPAGVGGQPAGRTLAPRDDTARRPRAGRVAHAAAGPAGHHHAVGPPLRAAPRRHPRRRPPTTTGCSSTAWSSGRWCSRSPT